MNDRQCKKLLCEIADGSVRAMENFYNLTKNFVYSYSLGITKNPAVAEDAMQEVYIRIIKYASSFDDTKDSATAYLIGIIRNCSFDQLKSARSFEQLDEELPWSDDGAESESAQASAELNIALMRLEESERNIVLMHEIGGYTFREIEKQLGIPKSSVNDTYKKAMAKLKDYLS